MKTFKEYRLDKSAKKLPAMETTFGKHSQEKPAKKLPAMETSMGKHSQEKQVKVSEDIEDHVLDREDQNHLHEKVAPLHADISKDEIHSVEKYTDNSRRLNSTLHNIYQGKAKSTISDVDSHVDHANVLGGMLNKHKTTEDMHVFTGINHSPASHFHGDSEHAEHTTVHLPAFTSTSSSAKTALGFSENTHHESDHKHGINSDSESKTVHLLKIHVPKGTHAASLKRVSLMGGENEILLHRAHNLQIDRHPQKIDHGIYMWHAKIVSHKPEDIN